MTLSQTPSAVIFVQSAFVGEKSYFDYIYNLDIDRNHMEFEKPNEPSGK